MWLPPGAVALALILKSHGRLRRLGQCTVFGIDICYSLSLTPRLEDPRITQQGFEPTLDKKRKPRFCTSNPVGS